MSDNKKEHFHNVIIRWVIIFATIEYIYLFIKVTGSFKPSGLFPPALQK